MTRPRRRPDYGIDSPAIVAAQFAVGVLTLVLAIAKPRIFGLHVRPLEIVIGIYFLQGAVSMVVYSRSGKLKLREQLLDMLEWRGDERVLDVGCGKGLLLVAAARRAISGSAVGVDLWLPHAMTGNSPEAALLNAELEGVSDRVTLRKGDVRQLPCDSETFDVAVSNFVLHELNTSDDREAMLREMTRVLKPGGRLALIDFIFTRECAEVLRRLGLEGVRRVRIGGVRHWIGAILMMGTFQLCAVTATRRASVVSPGHG
jgi:SAM-dependent methyltransferase